MILAAVLAFFKAIPLRFYLYAALLAAIGGGALYVHHRIYTAGIAAGEAEGHRLVAAYTLGASEAVAAYKANEAAARKDAAAITAAGLAVEASNENQTHENVKTITRIVHDTPSPAVCVSQPGVVRNLAEAIRDANAAARH